MTQPPQNASAPKRIGVAFSGGVDSAVSVRLLREQGWDVEAWHMLTCTAQPEPGVAQLAEALDVPLHLVDVREPFEKSIVAPFYKAYASGLTPNPCVWCNPLIKFGLLREAIGGMMATGHYVGKGVEPESGVLTLQCAHDAAKDQSYFLYGLSSEVLAQTVFPLAGKTRQEVVALARAWKLPLPEAKLASGSQDVCFLHGCDYRAELLRRYPEANRPGDILDMAGKVIGRHTGLANYTRGQRRGIGVAVGERAFVVSFDRERNTITLGTQEDLRVRSFFVSGIHWIVPPTFPLRCSAVSRYHHRAFACVVESDGRVIADEPQTLVTPGQSCVFYRENWVLGGGTIAEGQGSFA